MTGALLLGLALALVLPGTVAADGEPPLDGVVIAGENAASAVGDGAGASVVGALRLPSRPGDYAGVEALVVGGDALARLDNARLRALLEYVGNCGRLVLVATPPDAEYVLTRRAGCGARFVATADTTGAREALADMLVERPRPMTGFGSLQTLLPATDGGLPLMTLFLGGFLGVYLVLALLPGLHAAATGFCLLAAVVAGILWTGGRNEAVVAWAEVDNGDRIARYVSLTTATATGRGSLKLPLAEVGRHPLRVVGPGAELDEEANMVRWSATLLARMAVEAAGSFPVEPTLRAEITDGKPRVCNRGNRPLDPSWLAVGDRVYAVPALSPGETWRPTGNPAPPSPPSRLLRLRADGLGVLQMLSIPGDPSAGEAWLLRRESVAPKELPCAG